MNVLAKQAYDNQVAVTVKQIKRDNSVVAYVNKIMKENFPGIGYITTADLFTDSRYEVELAKDEFDKHQTTFNEIIKADKMDVFISLMHASGFVNVGIKYNNSGLKFVGVTGGIGVGKSFLINQLDKSKYATVDLDTLAKYAITHDEKLIEYLSGIYDNFYQIHDGEIVDYSTTLMKEFLFESIDNSLEFNEMLIDVLYKLIIDKHKDETRTLVVEGATMFESFFCRYVDFVVNIDTDTSLTYNRIKERSGLTDEQIDEFQQHQLSNLVRRQLSDYNVKTLSELTNVLENM